mgnify:CR=1 FL=1
MSNFTKSIDGLEQFVWLVRRFNMTSLKALRTMQEHNQDISFIKDVPLEEASLILDKLILEFNSDNIK